MTAKDKKGAELAQLRAEVKRLRSGAADAVRMIKQCTGHPDRDHPQFPAHFDMIQQARAERDEARAEVDQLKARLEKAHMLIGEQAMRDLGIEPPAPEPPPCPRCGGPNREHYVDTGSPGRPVRRVRLESPEAAEAASPKAPRVFRVGDAAPDSSVKLRDSTGGFIWETSLVPSPLWGNEYGQWMPWERLVRDYGPLAEVSESPRVGA